MYTIVGKARIGTIPIAPVTIVISPMELLLELRVADEVRDLRN